MPFGNFRNSAYCSELLRIVVTAAMSFSLAANAQAYPPDCCPDPSNPDGGHYRLANSTVLFSVNTSHFGQQGSAAYSAVEDALRSW
jgi:hypothetical protein